MTLYGALETGGTKCVCAVGSSIEGVVAYGVIPTTTAEETLSRAARFFQSARTEHGEIERLGVGSFGPICVDRKSTSYGRIGITPKQGWADVNIRNLLECKANIDVTMDTDVNCALAGEALWGAGRNVADFVYITVGTGVGGALMVDGKLVRGFSHPELGHMFVPKASIDADFPGTCPFHADQCLEGLAAGPALLARTGLAASELRENHVIWETESQYLAIACANLLLITAPRKIILGGGVMQNRHLFARIRRRVAAILNGYAHLDRSGIDLDSAIIPPELGTKAGIAGAFELARNQCWPRLRPVDEVNEAGNASSVG